MHTYFKRKCTQSDWFARLNLFIKICMFAPMLILPFCPYRKQYKLFAFSWLILCVFFFCWKRTYLGLCKYRLHLILDLYFVHFFLWLAEIWTIAVIDFLKIVLCFQVTFQVTYRCGLMHADLRIKYMCNRRKSGQYLIIFDHLFSQPTTIFYLLFTPK